MLPIQQLWAKSPGRIQGHIDLGGCAEGTGAKKEEGYPLLPHMLDVAAVGAVLLRGIPCPVPAPCSEEWISALVGMHDLGKASPGFQTRLGRSHIGGYRLEQDQPDRHDIATVTILCDLLKIQGLNHRTAVSLSHAVAAHHGSPFSSDEIARGSRWDVTESWGLAHQGLYQGVIQGIGVTGLPGLPEAPADRSAFLQWLMGLTTTADWIGSSEALCRGERMAAWNDDPRAWFEEALQLAYLAIESAGLLSPSLPPASDGRTAVLRVLGPDRQPRPLQEAIASVLDELPNGPALIVIEAPMGEGKTEAALSCTAGSRGIYIAMPTQATSNALFGRLVRFLDDHSTVNTCFRVALAHGSGGTAATELKLREIGLGSSDSQVQASWWFQGSKRALLCPQGIGTVDQGLIGVLTTRHGFLRLFGLSGRTVIFDEVHAYDAYTGGLIERLIAWLKVLGCRVVIMSATLPAARRDSLLKVWAGQESFTEKTKPYPRIHWALTGKQGSVAFASSRKQVVKVRSISSDLNALAKQASCWAHKGARVLVVVNKVSRAQALFRRLADAPATLFHARFPMRQRLEIEKQVLRLFGQGGSGAGGHVLVATQVAEQSLDIDFDVLITDPAPVDLMLQRQGRIHRHERDRPEWFQEPVIYVVELEEIIPAKELTSFVYSDWSVLRSVAWMRKHRVLHMPEDIDKAVQDVYGDWMPTESPMAMVEIEKVRADHENDLLIMADQARQAALRLPEDWRIGQSENALLDDNAAEAGAIRFGTRLGQDSQSVIPVTVEDLDDLDERSSFLFGNYLRLSHRALIKHVRQQEKPQRWHSHGGFSHHCPLLINSQGEVEGAPISARIDPVLGLVIGEEP